MNAVLKNLLLLAFLCLMVFQVGCAHKPEVVVKEVPKEVKPTYTPRSELRMSCVDKLIRLDVKPLEAGQICGDVYQQR